MKYMAKAYGAINKLLDVRYHKFDFKTENVNIEVKILFPVSN